MEAINAFESMLSALLDVFTTDNYIVALTDGVNFRKDVLPTYKGNRNERDKPFTLSALRAYILDAHPTYMRPNLEADDVLGILATSTKILPGTRRIIVSIDKDMKSVPGEFYNSKHDELFTISEEEANLWHMMQTLMGDTADGYSGCPGIGPKRAEKILEGLTAPGQMWAAVTSTFKKAGLTETEALTQARVARILRCTDYDFANKKVKLWKPPISGKN